MTKQISPTPCLGTWNKFSLELCEWNENLAGTRPGRGPGSCLTTAPGSWKPDFTA